jgi:hypothetical protein
VPQAFDTNSLEHEAMNRTGLEDFGPGDWREAMARLLEAAQAEAQLNDAGRYMLRAQVTSRLVNRLEIQDWVLRHPELRDQRVEAPLVLATLPRSGQTAAGWIFDRDPANRALLSWFAKRPCPPPLPGRNQGDPRIEQERAAVRATPAELRDMHLSDAEEPDECHFLISNSFNIPHEIYTMRVPSYYRFTRDEADMRSAYEYYRLQLQLLQSRDPGRRWVLKNSPHLLYLDDLHAVLPDAVFVQFHRDPLKVLASNCRLSLFLRGMMSDHVDPHEVGESMLQLLCDYLERSLSFRAKQLSRPWIDLRFSKFVADPLCEIERVYAAAGISLSDEAHAGMADWVQEHPRNDSAREPDLAPYGIEASAARERFASYVERFDVEFDGI